MGYSQMNSKIVEDVSMEIPFDMPIIDFEAMTNGSPEERAKQLSAMDQGFMTYGFVYLSNSCIPEELVNEAFEWSKRFFALPKDVKLKAEHPAYENPYSHRGYAVTGHGRTTQLIFDPAEIEKAHEACQEIKETYELGNGLNSNLVPNNWVPEEDLPGFRAFHERWWIECKLQAESLLKCLGQALKLDDTDALYKFESENDAHMSLMHYLETSVGSIRSGKHTRLNAHSDYSTLTMLWPGPIGGLEVHDGEAYKPIVPKKGTIILNVGDMLERQSNGRWKSSLHRVVAPREIMIQEGYNPKSTVVERYSIVYFSQPNADVIIETLPGCEKPGKWKPNMMGDWNEKITSLEWLHKRYTAEFH